MNVISAPSSEFAQHDLLIASVRKDNFRRLAGKLLAVECRLLDCMLNSHLFYLFYFATSYPLCEILSLPTKPTSLVAMCCTPHVCQDCLQTMSLLCC